MNTLIINAANQGYFWSHGTGLRGWVHSHKYSTLQYYCNILYIKSFDTKKVNKTITEKNQPPHFLWIEIDRQP